MAQANLADASVVSPIDATTGNWMNGPTSHPRGDPELASRGATEQGSCAPERLVKVGRRSMSSWVLPKNHSIEG